MPKKLANAADRQRVIVAQEAARLIVDQGIRDYHTAKTKAAQRLGLNHHGALPGNLEIEQAIGEHLQLFAGQSHVELLQQLRIIALSAMALLDDFSPRLVGPVLQGTADGNSRINLHCFCDTPELVALHLSALQLAPRELERRFKVRRDRAERQASFQFEHRSTRIEVNVFPVDGIRQAPIGPVDGKPMRRADSRQLQSLIESGKPAG